MRVNNITSTNFKSGLTRQILQEEARINPQKVENYFKKSKYSSNYYDFKNIDLKNNKAYALAFRMCAEIFKNFSRMHNYSGRSYIEPHVFPSDIIVFNETDLSDTLSAEEKSNYLDNFQTIGSHIFKRNGIFKNQKDDIRIGSILVPNIFDNLVQINENENTAHNKQNRFHSSNHFLHLFVHEWIHSIGDFYLYRESGCNSGSNYEATINFRKQKKLNNKECEVVNCVLGEYASTRKEYQYDEVVTEAWTKFICNSLDKDCIHFKKDPVELMEQTPKEFRKILQKVSTIKLYEHNYLTGKDKPSNRSAICFYPQV